MSFFLLFVCAFEKMISYLFLNRLFFLRYIFFLKCGRLHDRFLMALLQVSRNAAADISARCSSFGRSSVAVLISGREPFYPPPLQRSQGTNKGDGLRFIAAEYPSGRFRSRRRM